LRGGNASGKSPLACQSYPKNAAPIPKFDIEGVRRDFPALHQLVNGKPLIWLDNAATTHKPQAVIDATSQFYSRDNSNIHRAAHALAARSTELFEAGREKVRKFLGAADAKEIIFVRGTTEAINLVAQSYGRKNIGAGDEIIVSELEHHANIVPWQLLAEQVGATLRVIPINDRGELILDEYVKLLGRKRSSFPSRTFPTRSARSIRSSKSSRSPTRAACPCSWTARNPRRTCRSMSPRWTPISMFSPATRFLARPASARCMASAVARSHAAVAGRRAHDQGRAV
jgi:hypothetical protein